MPMLAEDQVRDYNDHGYLYPLPAVSADAAQALREDLAELEKREGADLWKRTKFKPHLLIKSLNELVRTPAILDAVEGVLGPDFLVWGVGHFAKPPHHGGYYSWHQDATYWGLSKPDLVTAWVALTPSTVESGCLRVIPGSHKHEQLPHRDTFAENNLLSRGQEVAVEVDETQAVDLVLKPGEMSLHHTMLVHGSGRNESDEPRIGIAIRYVAAHVSHTPGFRDSATLVRGNDRFGHYIPEPTPSGNFDPACVALYEDIVQDRVRRRDAIATGTAA